MSSTNHLKEGADVVPPNQNATTPKRSSSSQREAASASLEPSTDSKKKALPQQQQLRDVPLHASLADHNDNDNEKPKAKSPSRRQISSPSKRKATTNTNTITPATSSAVASSGKSHQPNESKILPPLPSLGTRPAATPTASTSTRASHPRVPATRPKLHTRPPSSQTTQLSTTTTTSSNVKEVFEEHVGKPSRDAVHSFFYPANNQDNSSSHLNAGSSIRAHAVSRSQQQQQQQRQQPPPPDASTSTSPLPQSTLPQHAEFDNHFQQQQEQDEKFVSNFWQIYDDLIMLSIFTQLGIVARLGSSLWFSFFDGVFSNNSALFVNLPLNCLSCFILGMLCSGESCMSIITTRFSPPKLQHSIQTHKLNAEKKEEDHADEHGGERDVASGALDPDHDDYPSSVPIPSPDSRHSGESGISRGGSIQHTLSDDSGDESLDSAPWSNMGMAGGGIFRRRRRRRGRRPKQDRMQSAFRTWQPPVSLNEDLRDVQLLALERRIRQSKCLLLFPVKKEDIDLMEHYFDEGYKKDEGETGYSGRTSRGGSRGELFHDDDMDALYLQASSDDDEQDHRPVSLSSPASSAPVPPSSASNVASTSTRTPPPPTSHNDPLRQAPSSPEPTTSVVPTPSHQNAPNTPGGESIELHGEQNTDLNQIVTEVSANVTENISRLKRVNLANGWDVGTSYDDMSDDLMLGLRFGFCGALSSFSSWNSAMINLIRSGKIGEAAVGYMLGLQLPIIGYRFGQHVAVYIFVWRCRQETRRDERRGYGIQLHTQGEEDEEEDGEEDDGMNPAPSGEIESESPQDVEGGARQKDSIDSQTPSIRAVITVVFIMAVVTQCTSISFYSEPQNQLVALSLLFSPLGVLARWRLSKYNSWRPTFPIGTFSCNILACALSGGLGRLLAGDPNEEERLVLQGLINGFGGTLSSVANFIVEILAGMDPILFRFDGVIYALWSVFWAMVIGFVFSASADWADNTGSD